MIPRFTPSFEARDVLTWFLPTRARVEDYEQAFAAKFGASEAVAFPYGRSAQWAFLRATGVNAAEVLMPAYTCSVVAHAVVLSGNLPKFVDISLDDYNPTAQAVHDSIGPRTRAVVATHTFGYPQDVNEIERAVGEAESRYGHKIWMIQDCAHAFGAEHKGRMVAQVGDVALFGLNISKIANSIFGGMLTFQDSDLAATVRRWRDHNLRRSGVARELRHRIYALAACASLTRPVFGLTQVLQTRTPLLDRWTKAYHLDEEIRFPPDHDRSMTRVAAATGLRQLGKYDEIVDRRRRNAALYDEYLDLGPDCVKPPLVEGATYSHYVVRVPDRERMVREWANRGVQLGELIQYSIPHMSTYLGSDVAGFPNSLLASRHTVNFPVTPDNGSVRRILEASLR